MNILFFLLPEILFSFLSHLFPPQVHTDISECKCEKCRYTARDVNNLKNLQNLNKQFNRMGFMVED